MIEVYHLLLTHKSILATPSEEVEIPVFHAGLLSLQNQPRKLSAVFFQNGGQFERLFINQIYEINCRTQRCLGILEAWLQDHEETLFLNSFAEFQVRLTAFLRSFFVALLSYIFHGMGILQSAHYCQYQKLSTITARRMQELCFKTKIKLFNISKRGFEDLACLVTRILL